MSRGVSPSQNPPYGVLRICQEWGVARSSLYAGRYRLGRPATVAAKRGPKTLYTDTQWTACIRAVVQDSPFVGEDHRKVWARLRHRGIRAGKLRVLRLTREVGLLAPHHAGPAHGPRNHEGTITT